jgi:hypothetical protein
MESKVTDEDLCAARHGHQVACAEYAARQRYFAMHAENPGMYEAATAENVLNACCGHLLTTIGLASRYPERASQINAMPALWAAPGLGNVMRAAMSS